MGLFKNYVSQTRKPEGKLGKMMLNGMNSGHAKMADCNKAREDSMKEALHEVFRVIKPEGSFAIINNYGDPNIDWEKNLGNDALCSASGANPCRGWKNV